MTRYVENKIFWTPLLSFVSFSTSRSCILQHSKQVDVFEFTTLTIARAFHGIGILIGFLVTRNALSCRCAYVYLIFTEFESPKKFMTPWKHWFHKMWLYRRFSCLIWLYNVNGKPDVSRILKRTTFANFTEIAKCANIMRLKISGAQTLLLENTFAIPKLV